MGQLFGTDGVRGVANTELTADLAFQLGRAGAYVLASETQHQPRILVGMDTRLSGDMLESALIAGICSVGAEAISCGVVPTPAIAVLVKKYNADAGVVISASHNSFEYNGIKFFSSEGYKLPDETENKIEDIILNKKELPQIVGAELGKKTICDTAIRDYVDFVKETIDIDLTGVKIAIDCANGASYVTSPLCLKELGAEVTVINNQPDGININKNCGSTHMGDLQELVKNGDYDIGLAFDGDADRMLACDENGELIDGDKCMAIVGTHMKNEGNLAKDTIVVTVMSNLGLTIYTKQAGINLEVTKVGDRYVLEEMLASGYCIGGEQSGHIIMLDYNTTGDGLLSGIQLLKVLKKSGKKASDLASIMQVLPQVLKNARVKNENKNSYMEDAVVREMCEKLEAEFQGEGRVLIRPSGTEPLVRVMIEGKDQEYITVKAKELAEVIETRLG